MTASSCRETEPIPSSLPGLTHCCPAKPHEPFLARFCTLPPLHPCGGDVSVRRQRGVKAYQISKCLVFWRRSSPPLSAIADISQARGETATSGSLRFMSRGLKVRKSLLDTTRYKRTRNLNRTAVGLTGQSIRRFRRRHQPDACAAPCPYGSSGQAR